MNTRRTRKMLWLTTAGLVAGVAAVVALHIVVPVGIATPSEASVTDRTSRDKQAGRSGRPDVDRETLERVAYRDIRQRLFDPPVKVPQPPPPKPTPSIELISTILRTGNDHSAWVREGQVVRKVAVGDTLGPDDNTALITAIASGKIVIKHEGKTLDLLQGPEHALGSGRRR